MVVSAPEGVKKEEAARIGCLFFLVCALTAVSLGP